MLYNVHIGMKGFNNFFRVPTHLLESDINENSTSRGNYTVANTECSDF